MFFNSPEAVHVEISERYLDRSFRLHDAAQRGNVYQQWLMESENAGGDWLEEAEKLIAGNEVIADYDFADQVKRLIQLHQGKVLPTGSTGLAGEDRHDLKARLRQGAGSAWDYELFLAQNKDDEIQRVYDQANNRLLWTYSMMSILYTGCVVIGFGFIVYFLKKGMDSTIGGRRYFEQWSASTVLGVYFLVRIAEALLWSGFINFLWGVYYDLGGQLDGVLLYDFLWRSFAAVLLSCLFIGSFGAFVRLFSLKDPVRWSLFFWAYGVLYMAGSLLFWVLPTSEIDPSDFIDSLDSSLSSVLAVFISSSLFAPIFEEIVFRGFLFQGIRGRLGSLKAGLISTVLFALMHAQYDLYGVLSVGLFGGVCCYLTMKTGSLKTAMALHITYNFFINLEVFVQYIQPFY